MKLKTIEAARRRSDSTRTDVASPQAGTPTPAEAATAAGERACPTRADGAMPLFQHRVTLSQCQSKQRGMYHKCFSCAHANAKR